VEEESGVKVVYNIYEDKIKTKRKRRTKVNNSEVVEENKRIIRKKNFFVIKDSLAILTYSLKNLYHILDV
jgi:hypothetical protein